MRPAPGKWLFSAHARKLIADGLGWEDLYVRMRPYGMTEHYAKMLVLGKEAAHILRDKQERRARERESMLAALSTAELRELVEEVGEKAS